MRVSLTVNKAVLPALKEAKAQALDAIGKRMIEHAADQVPVDTGRLRDSLDYTVLRDQMTAGTDVPYAPYVEVGRAGREGTHFLRNALEQHGEEYAGIIVRAMKGGDTV